MTTKVSHAPELGTLSKALQSLHHSLLEHQAYQSGFFGSPFDLFARASDDDAFRWLKPLRQAIVELDERRSDAAPLSESEARDMVARIEELIDADQGPFRNKLNAVFQTSPEAIWSVKSARGALSALA